MNLQFIKWSILSIALFGLLQCQAKPTENKIIENGNYKELSELIRNSEKLNGGGVNFVAAAALSTPCVVHIKTKTNVAVNYYNPFQNFFGFDFNNQPRVQKQEASGSGVIIAQDGYIVTNYHVVQNANEIEVTLRNKNTYKAQVLGYDKDTDLALLKIEEKQLPALQIANSDSVMVGEWVLAVGNPFNLESTVTQGIVSAKGRSLNLGNQGNNANSTQIESFIQTDAAVNPGNSGGALVNLKGELIGINTAIASPTGAYAGYAFAVPSNLVKKVVNDLKQYGNVQRAYLGIGAGQLTSAIAKELKLPSPNGVLVSKIYKGSAADEANLQPNDVILKINQFDISSFPELLEHINTYSPGNEVEITYYRNGGVQKTNAVLKNINQTTEIIKGGTNDIQKKLGVILKPLNESEARRFNVRGGVKIEQIGDGIIGRSTEIKAGFIILAANGQEVTNDTDLIKVLQSRSDSRVSLEGFYPNRSYTYQYSFNLN